jgi:hypothetical protein
MDARYKIAEAMMRGVGQPMAAFPDQRQDADMSLRGMASDLYQADQRRAQDYRAGIKEAILQSWPAELAKSAYGAVTLPGDVYAGKVNPMSDEAVGRAAEFAGLMTLGAGGIPAGKNEMRMGIKAYHGSPHDFDRFDMSKIGTGEGAQAYGHGLYFADKEALAKSYRDALTPAVNAQKPGYRSSQDWLDQFSSPIEARKEVDSMIKMIRARGDEQLAKEYELIRHHLDNPYAGRMYEVNLNTTPDRLLDWDKPLKEQSPNAQKAWERFLDSKAGRSADKSLRGDLFAARGQFADPTGQTLYTTMSEGMIGVGAPRPFKQVQAEAAEALKKRGLDGIKYLDAGSRAAGDGSRNYVMFDDKLVQILRKYGVATAAALPAAALAELGMSREEAKRSF